MLTATHRQAGHCLSTFAAIAKLTNPGSGYNLCEHEASSILKTMLVDAHFHADDLVELDPGFPARYLEAGVVGLASVHNGSGLETTRRIMDGAGSYLISFGLHPQSPVMTEAERLESLASSGQIAAIGECGFDFYGDIPQRVRNDENLRVQIGRAHV